MKGHKNYSRVYASVIVVLLSFMNGLTSVASTLFVNVNDVNCSDQQGKPFCHLKSAVNQSRADDVIQIASGQYAGGIVIERNVTLRGVGAAMTVIDSANHGFGVAIDEFVEVNIKGVTIQNGFSENGGGIRNHGDLTLSDCIIKKNVAKFSGGGIFNGGPANAKLSINRCVISQNKALGDDKYNVKYGGGGVYNNGVLRINETRIIDNLAKENGGGIYTIHAGKRAIKESTLILSKLGFYAGVHRKKRLGSSASLADVRIINTMISGNRADNGGGINVHTALELRHSTINDNMAAGSNISAGGGIFAHFDAHLHLVNNTLSGNHAQARGGGLRFYSKVASALYFTTIAYNTVGDRGEGAGIYVVDRSAKLSIFHTLLTNNTSRNPLSADCEGAINSHGYNLVGLMMDGCQVNQHDGDQFGTQQHPLSVVLLPLQHNGGYTKTHALPKNSLAVDAGQLGECRVMGEKDAMADQRGNMRPFDGNGDAQRQCDIGAFEFSL